MDSHTYMPRKPRQSAHFQLVEDHFEDLECLWDDRYSKKYGNWRNHVAKVIYEYLGCGDLRNGFARIRCTSCGHEYLLPFTCKRRHFCPSCHARRVIEFGEFLASEVLSDVPHRQWVFSIPKMLRPWFLHDRRLLGELARIVWKVLSKFIKTSSTDDLLAEAFPACVIAIQTFGEHVNFNPHIHVIAADGCFTKDGGFIEAWAHDTSALNEAFAREVFGLLADRGLSESRIETIMSWQHSGFQVYRGSQILATDTEGEIRLAQYIVRCPFALSRMDYDRGTAQVTYRGKTTGGTKHYTALDFLARLVVQIPAPKEQMVRYLGYYSNKSRGLRKKETGEYSVGIQVTRPKRPSSKRWAQLIAKVFLDDPLCCPKCQKPMRIISFVDQGDVIAKMLRHLGLWEDAEESPVAHAPPPFEFEEYCSDDYSQYCSDDYSQLPPTDLVWDAC